MNRVRFTFDSDLNNKYLMPSSYPLDLKTRTVPDFMAKSFRIEAKSGGAWKTVAKEENNYQRLVRLPLDATASGIRIVLEETWGGDAAHIFACDVG